MKPVALLLISLIVFLSGFSEMVTANIKPVAKAGCCEETTMACHQQPAKKKKADNCCGQCGCDMMFACSLCGFLIKQPLTIQAVHPNPLPKPVAHYITGNAAGYYPNSWKPPQIC